MPKIHEVIELPEKKDESTHFKYPTRFQMTNQGFDYGWNAYHDALLRIEFPELDEGKVDEELRKCRARSWQDFGRTPTCTEESKIICANHVKLLKEKT